MAIFLYGDHTLNNCISPYMRAESSWPNHLVNVPPLNTVTTAMKFPPLGFRGTHSSHSKGNLTFASLSSAFNKTSMYTCADKQQEHCS